MIVFEGGYKDDMTREEAIDLAARAIRMCEARGGERGVYLLCLCVCVGGGHEAGCRCHLQLHHACPALCVRWVGGWMGGACSWRHEACASVRVWQVGGRGV